MRWDRTPASAAQAREWLALGWQRLAALHAEDPQVHAGMVASWGCTLKAAEGAPNAWKMAINCGAMPAATWQQGIELCRDAIADERAEEAAYLEQLAGKVSA